MRNKCVVWFTKANEGGREKAKCLASRPRVHLLEVRRVFRQSNPSLSPPGLRNADSIPACVRACVCFWRHLIGQNLRSIEIIEICPRIFRDLVIRDLQFGIKMIIEIGILTNGEFLKLFRFKTGIRIIGFYCNSNSGSMVIRWFNRRHRTRENRGKYSGSWFGYIERK